MRSPSHPCLPVPQVFILEVTPRCGFPCITPKYAWHSQAFINTHTPPAFLKQMVTPCSAPEFFHFVIYLGNCSISVPGEQPHTSSWHNQHCFDFPPRSPGRAARTHFISSLQFCLHFLPIFLFCFLMHRCLFYYNDHILKAML